MYLSSLSLEMRVGREADVVAVVTGEDFTGKEAKERTLLHGQGARGEERRCARGAGKVRAERTPRGTRRGRRTEETAGERRPRLATEKAKLPASANWFSGISRLQVVVGENNDNNDEDDDDDGR